MTDKKRQPEPGKKNFPWIKARLDPGSGYIIFEHDLKLQELSLLDSTPGVRRQLERQAIDWQQVVDSDLFIEYLVIQVPAGDEDRLLGKILGFGFPEDIVFYIFKAKEG